MTYALKKIHVAITTLLLTAIGQIHADYDPSTSSECGNSCFCASAFCGKGFISADLLYWRAFEDGLDNCFSIEDSDYVTSGGHIISKSRGKGRDPRFKWDAGFRLGTGYEFANGWDIAAFWTHFHSHASRHFGNEVSSRNEKETRWNLKFEVVDLIVAREFVTCSCFTWRPFAGLRGARIKQKIRTNFISQGDFSLGSSSDSFFSDLSPSIYSTSASATSSAHSRQRFLGIGPLIGIEGEWDLSCGFSLYANAAVAVLYGHFHVRSKESDIFEDGAEFCSERRRLEACQTVVDAGLGVRWLTCLCGYTAWLQLGLEHHSYFNQNRFGDYGDLSLDGANFSAGIAF
jgi:hypothetical protein